MRGFLKEYEKAAKYISKQKDLFIQRDGESIYLSNGHYLVKIQLLMYNACFRTTSPRFIDITDGETASARSDKKALPVVMPEHNAVDFRRCVPVLSEEYIQAEKTPYTCETQNGDLQIFAAGDYLVYVSAEYWKNLKVFCSGSLYGKTNKTGIFSDFADDVAAFILPVNHQETSKFEIVNTEKLKAQNVA